MNNIFLPDSYFAESLSVIQGSGWRRLLSEKVDCFQNIRRPSSTRRGSVPGRGWPQRGPWRRSS